MKRYSDCPEPPRRRDRGQALILVTLGIFCLMGLLGLVVDVGYGYYLKQAAQAAADSAALAAAVAAQASAGACGDAVLCQSNYTCPSNPTNATNFGAGCLYAKQNGFGNTAHSSVTLSSGTGATGGVTATYWVKAVATTDFPAGFATMIGAGRTTVNADATAAFISAGGGGCVYVLDTSGGITASGAGSVSSSCGIFVNGNITLSGSVGVHGTGGANVNIKGTVTTSGTASVSPVVQMGSTVSDPLASLPTPTYSTTCTNSSPVTIVNQSSYTLPAGVYCGGITVVNSTVTLNPGTFTGGINSSGGTLNFNPGTYAFTGSGGITSSGSNNFNGTGVMLYFKNGTGITGSGGNTFAMTGETSGTYRGILIFGDRTSGSGSLTFSGATSSSGTIYLPKGSLTFSGGTSVSPITMALICWDLTFSGNTFINKDTNGSLTGLGSSGTYLVE